MGTLKKNNVFWLVLACLAIFFTNFNALYVNIMEARNFITAREMLNDGNWLLTTINGLPRYQKPPLPTWLTAFSGGIFGLDSLAALRLPAALMGTLTILATYFFSVRILKNKKLAFIGTLILVSSFYIVLAGRDANWDIFTHAFMMVCIYSLYLLFTSEDKKYQYALLAAIFFGFSFMSKGPVSLYALLLPFLIAYGVVYKFKKMKAKLAPLLIFLVVALIISGWWYWYTYTFDAATVLKVQSRETSNWTGYNVRPFYYYWSFFTQSGVWTIPAFVGLLYPYLKNRVVDKKGYLFTFLWTMGSVVLLSIIPEKKSRYLLPVLIPMALNTAFYIEYLFRRFKELKDKRETIPVYLHFSIVASIGVLFPIAGFFFLKDFLAEKWPWYVLLSLSLFAIGFLMFKHLFRRNIKPVFYLNVAFIAAIMCFGMPMAKTFTVNPAYTSFEKLNRWGTENNMEIYELSDFTPELVWDFGKPIPIILGDDGIGIPEASTFGVLVSKDDQTLFTETFKGYSVEKIRRYDMNPQPAENRSHRTRLWRDLYVVRKN